MIDLPEKPDRETEAPLMRRILVAVNRLPLVRVARNNNGNQPNATGQWISYGLGDGSGDLQGRIQIGVPGRFAMPCVFWLEVKTPHGRTSKKRAEIQLAFREEAATRGELTAIVKSEEEAIAAVETIRAEYTRRMRGGRE